LLAMVAWTGITGFLASTFWFPFENTHVVTPVAPPVQKCKNDCTARTDCCLWAVNAVTQWSDVPDNAEGVTHLGWEIQGKDLATFLDATWCLNHVCTGAVAANEFTITKNKVIQPVRRFRFKAGGAAEESIGSVERFPGRDGFAFYMLMVMTDHAFTFFDITGKQIKQFGQVDALKNLKGDPANNADVTFVKSYSCGQFLKVAPAATIRLNSDESGLLARCVGGGGTVPTESNVDEQAAFAAALAKVNHQWSVDASAGSHGISFASIVCAVLSSVSLVFLVFFVAKKNSHLEVAVADE